MGKLLLNLEKMILSILKSIKTEPKEQESLTEAEKESEIGIQKSFLTQFAENQNHHQKLFIQFLSSVLIVIVAYAYVYSNTASSSGIKVYNNNNIVDSLKQPSVGQIIVAEKFDSVKYDNGAIMSYSQLALLSIYAFAQIVLLVLSIMILHMGYSYRRDQCVVNKIRRINMGKKTYELTFESRSYNGKGKGFLEYLPNFNSILFFSICIIQIALFISIFLYFKGYDSMQREKSLFITIKETLLLPQYTIYYRELRTSLIFPLLINLFLYTYYYNRYEFTINGKETYVPELEKIDNKGKIYLLYFLVIGICIGSLVYQFYNLTRIIHLWTFIYFYFIIIIPIIFYWFFRKRIRVESISQFVQGLAYLFLGITLFAHSYYYFERHDTYLIEMSPRSLILVGGNVFIYIISAWAGIWLLNDKDLNLANYIKKHNRFLLILFYVFVIVFFLKLKWLDYMVSCFFAIYSILIGRRKIIKWRKTLWQ